MLFEPRKVTFSVISTAILPFVFASNLVWAGEPGSQAPFHQVQNNAYVDSDELDVTTPENKTAISPLDLPPVELIPVTFNLDDFIPAGLKAVFSPAGVKEFKIRVNIFPVLNYNTRMFMREQAGDPIFGATPANQLDGFKLSANGSPLQIQSWPDRKLIVAGNQLSFDLKSGVFVVDGHRFAMVPMFVSQNADEIASAQWPGLRNGGEPLYLHGDFMISEQTTPRGAKAVKVINVVNFETYLKEVVPTEMTPGLFGPQALATQAIAARTFSVFRKLMYGLMGCDFDIKATTQDQEYGGVKREEEKSNAAVAATKGQILMYGDHVVLAMFSSNPVIQTVACKDYVNCGKDIPYLISVQERHPQQLMAEGHHVRQVTESDLLASLKVLSSKYTAQKLDFSANQTVLRTEPLGPFRSGRPTSLKIVGDKTSVIVSGLAFDTLVADMKVHAFMDIGHSNTVDIRGKSVKVVEVPYWGTGHGVGLSQLGAKYDEELDGWSAKQILELYYPGAKQVDMRTTKLADTFAI